MKVTIVGCGNVGMAISHALLLSEIADDIVLLNRTKQRAVGEAIDLQDAVAFCSKWIRVRGGDIEDAVDSDLVIMTLSDKPKEPLLDRNDMAALNLPVMRKWIPRLAKACPKAVFVMVSNPVDIMTWLAWKLSGLPARQFIGTGTLIDSARWRLLLSLDLNIHPSDIRAYIFGEHGSTQFPATSLSVTGGQKIDDLPRYEQLFQKASVAAFEIYNRKGNTSFGIASATMTIADSVLRDTNRTLPVSVVLEDHYGVSNVCLSVPVIVGRGGVERMLYPKLSDGEVSKFQASAAHVRAVIDSLGNIES